MYKGYLLLNMYNQFDGSIEEDIIVGEGIVLRSYLDQHIAREGTANTEKYIKKILQDHVIPFTLFVGKNLMLTHGDLFVKSTLKSHRKLVSLSLIKNEIFHDFAKS